MNRLRSILFTGIVLLFPCIQLLDWARTSSAVNALVSHFGVERADRWTDAALAGRVENVVLRLRQDDPAETYESRFAPLRPYLPLDQRIGYVVDLGWRGGRVRPFIYTQYALAPAVMTDSEDAEYVVANFSSESVLDGLAEGQVTICRKLIVAADSTETDELPESPVAVTRPVIATPRLLNVDYQRELYRCGDDGGFRIVRRFGDGVAILKRVAEGE